MSKRLVEFLCFYCSSAPVLLLALVGSERRQRSRTVALDHLIAGAAESTDTPRYRSCCCCWVSPSSSLLLQLAADVTISVSSVRTTPRLDKIHDPTQSRAESANCATCAPIGAAKSTANSRRRSYYCCLGSLVGKTEFGSCWLSYGTRATTPLRSRLP